MSRSDYWQGNKNNRAVMKAITDEGLHAHVCPRRTDIYLGGSVLYLGGSVLADPQSRRRGSSSAERTTPPTRRSPSSSTSTEQRRSSLATSTRPLASTSPRASRSLRGQLNILLVTHHGARYASPKELLDLTHRSTPGSRWDRTATAIRARDDRQAQGGTGHDPVYGRKRNDNGDHLPLRLALLERARRRRRGGLQRRRSRRGHASIASASAARSPSYVSFTRIWTWLEQRVKQWQTERRNKEDVRGFVAILPGLRDQTCSELEESSPPPRQ